MRLVIIDNDNTRDRILHWYFLSMHAGHRIKQCVEAVVWAPSSPEGDGFTFLYNVLGGNAKVFCCKESCLLWEFCHLQEHGCLWTLHTHSRLDNMPVMLIRANQNESDLQRKKKVMLWSCPFQHCYQLSSGDGFRSSLPPSWSPLIIFFFFWWRVPIVTFCGG